MFLLTRIFSIMTNVSYALTVIIRYTSFKQRGFYCINDSITTFLIVRVYLRLILLVTKIKSL